MPTTSSRVSAGAPVRSSRSLRQTSRVTSSSAAVRSVIAAPRASRVSAPVRSATATRNSSERRMVRAASTAEAGSSLRPAADRIRRSTSSRERGIRPEESPRNCTHSGRLLEQVGGEPAAGQGVRQPFCGRPLVAQQPQVPVRRAELVADLAEGEQAGIRVGLVGEPAEHDRQQLALDGGPPADAAGERLEVAQRATGVAETQRGQPLARGLGSEPHVGVGQPGDGRRAAGGRRSARAGGAPRAAGRATGRRRPRRARSGVPEPGPAGAGRSRPSGIRWVRRSRNSWMRCSRVRSSR